MSKKRGLSTIVSTLLILLLVFVAIGILWVVVRNVIQQGTEQVSLGKFTLDLAIDQVEINEDTNQINVRVKRNPGEGEFVAIKFIFSDGENTEVFDYNVSLQEHEKRSFTFNIANLNISNLKKIEIAPIFRLQSGKEVTGDVKSKWEKSSTGDNYNYYNPVIINEPTENETGGECTLDTECTTDYYSNNFCTGNSVYRNFYDFSCNSTSQCSYSASQQLVQNCNSTQTCTSGVCVNNQQQQTGTPTSARIIAVTASNTSSPSTMENTLDGNLSAESRWSAEGDGQWIRYEFNQTVNLNSLQIAFYLGDQRTATFSIEVSTTGSTWTRVLDHQVSSGAILGFQTFTFNSVDARYLRIVGHGNSDSLWNSYTEVQIENFVSTVSTTPVTCTGSSTQSCTITNGVGQQIRTCNNGQWSNWGTCTVVSCNSGYVPSGNSCVVSGGSIGVGPPAGMVRIFETDFSGTGLEFGTMIYDEYEVDDLPGAPCAVWDDNPNFGTRMKIQTQIDPPGIPLNYVLAEIVDFGGEHGEVMHFNNFDAYHSSAWSRLQLHSSLQRSDVNKVYFAFDFYPDPHIRDAFFSGQSSYFMFSEFHTNGGARLRMNVRDGQVSYVIQETSVGWYPTEPSTGWVPVQFGEWSRVEFLLETDNNGMGNATVWVTNDGVTRLASQFLDVEVEYPIRSNIHWIKAYTTESYVDLPGGDMEAWYDNLVIYADKGTTWPLC